MSDFICTKILTEPLNIQEAYNFVSDPAHGAVDMFIGAVRNHHKRQDVEGITYDVHAPLAEKTFQDICQEAQTRWNGIKTYISHYKGRLDIEGISVIIAVSSPYRAESFEACRYIIEQIKERSPVWKQEHYTSAPSQWLPGHSLNTKNNE